MPLAWQTGIDIRAEEPVRNLRGEIDFASESGGITGEILVKILEHFDKMNLFPRTAGGPIPVLLVDGHGSRLDPAFVDYINNESHPWKVCLGVPYATTLWQVGDASEQNGKFKSTSSPS